MENENKQPRFFEAPPQTMFVFGLVTGIALTLLIQPVFASGIKLNKDTGINTALNQPTEQTPTTPTTVSVPAISKDDYVRGNRKAKIVLYEYSDMQCPYCERHHPTMNALLDKYGDDIAWVYRHFPLTSIHAEAMPSALAAECIGEQKGDEGFFKFVDQMFVNQSTLGSELYKKTAQDLGANMDKFNECVSSQKYLSKVQEQQSSAGSQGLGATPSTVVNNTLVEGAESLAKFTSIIDTLKK